MNGSAIWLGPDAPERVIAHLGGQGFRVVGPRVEDGVLVLEELTAGDSLPTGWHDRAAPGSYRLERREGNGPRARERFGYRVGAQAWKRYLHPPELRLFTAERAAGGGLDLHPEKGPEAPLALIGVRPCDLTAIAVQDRVLMGGRHVDEAYAARRHGAFLVVVECTTPGATCFCASFGSGPGAEGGFDLALTELIDDERHGFVARAGSARGEALLEALGGRPASAPETDGRRRAVDEAAHAMGRRLDVDGARSALAEGAGLPLWNDVAERCLNCANCTLVCPTCFCVTIEDVTDLSGDVAERRRRWDSCFSLDFSYLHGGSVRRSGAARYRQWLTHKLSSWFEQFGEAGCVGCGRCIAWCPVGIDLTQEAAIAIEQRRQADAMPRGRGPAGRGARR